MAALLTSQLEGAGEGDGEGGGLIINDVLPMTLGIQIKGGAMQGILKKGWVIPGESDY